MPNCEKSCGECGKCVGAFAQIAIDEKDAEIKRLSALLESAQNDYAALKDAAQRTSSAAHLLISEMERQRDLALLQNAELRDAARWIIALTERWALTLEEKVTVGKAKAALALEGAEKRKREKCERCGKEGIDVCRPSFDLRYRLLCHKCDGVSGEPEKPATMTPCAVCGYSHPPKMSPCTASR